MRSNNGAKRDTKTRIETSVLSGRLSCPFRRYSNAGIIEYLADPFRVNEGIFRGAISILIEKTFLNQPVGNRQMKEGETNFQEFILVIDIQFLVDIISGKVRLLLSDRIQ